MKRFLAFAPLAVLAALAVMFLGFSLKRDPNVHPDALVGQALPDLQLADLDTGAAAPLRQSGGHAYFVNVFASWCVPCAGEVPALARLQAGGAPIIGVDYKDKPVAATSFLKSADDPYQRVLADPSGRAAIDLGITGVPETFLVGRDGKVLAKISAPLDDAAVDALLAQWKAADKS